jgi:hypothetical protein
MGIVTQSGKPSGYVMALEVQAWVSDAWKPIANHAGSTIFETGNDAASGDNRSPLAF